MTNHDKPPSSVRIPWFGARKFARRMAAEADSLRNELNDLRSQFQQLGTLDITELEARRRALQREIAEQSQLLLQEREKAKAELAALNQMCADARKGIVETEEQRILQEVGVYRYRHPLSDAIAYQAVLKDLESNIREMNKKDGGAVLCTSNWTVNGSDTEGRKMVQETSKLMLRAFNAEADNLVRGLKPYKLEAAIARIRKVAETIERLGKTLQISITPEYEALRVRELELTADFLEKKEEEREADRRERERLKEERRVHQELERERAKLEKERQHYLNALEALGASGDAEGMERLRAQLADVDRAMEDVDYRAANVRAGYVYVISNIGSFGEQVVKVGMTRRLDPLDRIRELSDASVPFNFDVHALFFSRDAVGIETEMHKLLGDRRINIVNRRREFFRATVHEVRNHLVACAGELLQFEDVPEALEYRQSLSVPRTS